MFIRRISTYASTYIVICFFLLSYYLADVVVGGVKELRNVTVRESFNKSNSERNMFDLKNEISLDSRCL